MEKTNWIESIKLYPIAADAQVAKDLERIVKNHVRELLLFPDPTESSLYCGILLTKYYTPELFDLAIVRETDHTGDFTKLSIPRGGIRTLLGTVMRKMQYAETPPEQSEDRILSGLQKPEIQSLSTMEFLKTKTPLQIERELNEQIIGQPALTRAVADFLYYHALRQLHPELPQRPLMVSGPSGNGKTEVWRAVKRLYGDAFHIKIIDGSNMSCEGWAGNYKINTFVDTLFAQGGILVVDEFDKLVKPKHNSKGDNVSLDMQAEFLKLIEGEYRVANDKKQTGVTSQKMGFVLVGAFESLREEKQHRKAESPRIGFCTETTPSAQPTSEAFSDADFIRYGIMPEIVGRIATKCSVIELNERAYLQILQNPNSRVSKIEKVLKGYGTKMTDVLSNEELCKLISASKSNRTGVRWVSAQVEGRLLDAIRERGIAPIQENAS